jgi:purine-binding chemotaxis protein CheW
MTAPDVQTLLEARARALAQPLPETPELGPQLDLLAFAMAGERYAVEARHVLEVIPMREPTPVPCTPPFVLGLLNHRGRVLPVLDLAGVLGTESAAAHHAVVAVAVGDLRFGIAIEAVDGVTRCEAARVGPADHVVRRIEGAPLAVLDLDALAADGRLEVDTRSGNSGEREP